MQIFHGKEIIQGNTREECEAKLATKGITLRRPTIPERDDKHRSAIQRARENKIGQAKPPSPE